MSERPDDPPSDAGDDLERLRTLLFPDMNRLEAIEALQDPEQFAQYVSRVLPHAASLRAARDDRLGEALAPTVEDALESSVRRNPKPLTDAIFPILGPAIRKAIAHAMQQLLQNVNQGIESTLTPKGIRLRMQAKRTGRSYAEMVIAQSLVYRVEEVFLIHGETGLLLAHQAVPDVVTPDTDLVSGMFTAIQDFVRDSFGVADNAGLEQFRVGELTVLVEQGPLAVIAAVVRGTPGGSVRTKLQETLEQIHAQNHSALESFDGDSERFRFVEPALRSCLTKKHRPPTEPTPFRKFLRRAVPAALLLALAGGAALWIGTAIRENNRRQRFNEWVTALRDHPGVQVQFADATSTPPRVAMIVDPLAKEALRKIDPLQPSDVELSVFEAPVRHSEYVLARAKQRLRPPNHDVVLTLGSHADDRQTPGPVIATGEAPISWIQHARWLGAWLETGYQDEGLWPSEWRPARTASRALEQIVTVLPDRPPPTRAAWNELLADALHALRRLDQDLPGAPSADVVVGLATGPSQPPGTASIVAFDAALRQLQSHPWKHLRIRRGDVRRVQAPQDADRWQIGFDVRVPDVPGEG